MLVTDKRMKCIVKIVLTLQRLFRFIVGFVYRSKLLCQAPNNFIKSPEFVTNVCSVNAEV